MPLQFEPAWEAPSDHICCGCGKAWRPLRSLRALNISLKACEKCIAAAGKGDMRLGRHNMREAANIALSIAEPPKRNPNHGRCYHCGGVTIPDMQGRTALWCNDCEKERSQYGNPGPVPIEVS